MRDKIAVNGMLLTAMVAGLLVMPTAAVSQVIAFEGELPRTMVFIGEEGRGKVAAREMTTFLLEAGFPVIDPALAIDESAQNLVAAAMAGNDAAATELGKNWGAQVLILGFADYATRPDPVDGTLVTATTNVSVRALRLDHGDVISTAEADARALDATDQAARTKAIKAATQEAIGQFIGAVMNDWVERTWLEAAYWGLEPTSFGAVTSNTASNNSSGGSGEAPGVAILSANVLPNVGTATRGIGVIKKGGPSLAGVSNTVRLEGVVIGETTQVEVNGAPAVLEPLEAGEAARLGIDPGNAQKFVRQFDLPISQDSVIIIAEGTGGATTHAVAAPRIDKRWAVIIGVGEYRSEDIPDLPGATKDARAMRDFFMSDLAGPFDKVIYLENEQATGAAMREALFVKLQSADWDDLVVIYFAGHGAPDPGRPDNLYLLPTDSDLNQLAATGFPMWDVKTALRRQISSERVLVIADACHSAGTADGDTVGGGESNAISGGFAQLFTPSRRLMMTAADTNEFAQEDARWNGNGVFTHFLLDGLKGAADADGDGIVTFTEVFDHVSKNVRQATSGQQNPQKSGFGDIPLAIVVGAGDG